MSIIVDKKENYTTFKVTGGVFMREGVREFSSTAKELIKKGKSRFIIDFSDCEYISSEGLGAITDIYKSCKSQSDGEFVVVFSDDPTNDVEYLFETVGLSMLLKDSIFSDYKKAEDYLIVKE